MFQHPRASRQVKIRSECPRDGAAVLMTAEALTGLPSPPIRKRKGPELILRAFCYRPAVAGARGPHSVRRDMDVSNAKLHAFGDVTSRFDANVDAEVGVPKCA